MAVQHMANPFQRMYQSIEPAALSHQHTFGKGLVGSYHRIPMREGQQQQQQQAAQVCSSLRSRQKFAVCTWAGGVSCCDVYVLLSQMLEGRSASCCLIDMRQQYCPLMQGP